MSLLLVQGAAGNTDIEDLLAKLSVKSYCVISSKLQADKLAVTHGYTQCCNFLTQQHMHRLQHCMYANAVCYAPQT